MKTSSQKTQKKKREQAKRAQEIKDERELIREQQRLREIVLSRLYKGSEIIEIRRQLEENDIQMEWYGMKFPRNILLMEHDIIQEQFNKLLREEKQLKESLKNDKGLTEKEIENLLNKNEFVKEVRK